jgi:uncharacterized membrane protein YfcA
MDISLLQFLMLIAAGIGAGILNSVAGGGTYFTFPLLLLAGIPPVLANTTNKIGVWLGSFGSLGGYWREVTQLRERSLYIYVATAVTGSVAGSLLLLVIPSDMFKNMVPWLMLAATVIFTGGQKTLAWLEQILPSNKHISSAACTGGFAAHFLISIYGGFFGAGMSIMFMALYELTGLRDVHRMNGLKTLVSLVVNAASVLTFVIAGSIFWPAAIPLMIGALAGGYWGASIARRLPAHWVRWFIILYSTGITIWLFLTL